MNVGGGKQKRSVDPQSKMSMKTLDEVIKEKMIHKG